MDYDGGMPKRPLRIAIRCSEDWGAMAEGEEGRRCEHCQKDVVDLSAMTETRARAWVALYAPRGLCGRVVESAEGGQFFAEPAPRRGEMRRGLGLAALALTVGCGGAPAPAPERPVTPAPRSVRAEPPAPIQVASQTAPSPVEEPSDRDHDGVVDAEDRCPDEAGAAAQEGCPKPVVVVTMGIVIATPQVQFAFQSPQIRAEDGALLTEVAHVMADHPEITLVTIEGHASLDERKAAELSELRARAVRDALVKQGVAPERLTMEAKGSDLPVVPNTTKEGRERNRRVTFRVVEKQACTVPTAVSGTS